MSGSTFYVSEASLRNLKHEAQRRISGVSSSHLSEGVAAALGFNTHAALRAELAGRTTAEVQKPSNARLVARLRQLGHAVPADLRLLPELDRSYSPFRTFPLRKKRSARWTAWRNLMVAAINAGLEQRLFGLSPGQDWWPGADPKNNGGERGFYRFMFDGDLSAVVIVDAIRGDELGLHVVLAPRKGGIRDDAGEVESGIAFAHGWLERKLGAWLMDGGEEFGCRRPVLSCIAGVVTEPLGYADQGSFIA